MCNRYEDRYVELTTQLRSIEAFCDFLANGGTVRVADGDGAAFKEVTASVLARQRHHADSIRKTRRQLFPDRADEQFQPLYTSH
ncbi:hypothetical protein [Rhizobium sp. S163]|uniref:hypothetical protein n=1 Tax=Rhizobium sp. S163 TaxID=3055039 RepID=UPI0025A9379F|nr:hypothetical protein [Rhizobium sp. S163]MDM9645602.1 hypothetical protein [Rhizobium sp. S163]